MQVILADDHAIVRQGLRSLLDDEAQLEIVAEAADGREAVELTGKHQPDVVIMDISMPLLSGLEATQQISAQYPQCKVLILSMHAEDSYVVQALKAGARAYVLKKAVYEELKLALYTVLRGEYYLSPALSGVVVEQLLQAQGTCPSQLAYGNLTPREREVLQLLAEQHSRSEIARLLMISPKTVDKHNENIRAKLKLDDEADLLQFARKLGLLEG